MVDLVLLHGPPASGKFSIAKELGALTGARVFHNHLTLDVAKSLLYFGEPEFWNLVWDLRVVAFESHFMHGAGTAITTWCYEEPEDRELFEKIKSIAAAAEGRVLPVFLHCDIASLEKRVGNTSRQEMEKLCDVEQLRNILSSKNYCAISDELCIEIDSQTDSAKYNALKIRKEFGL